MNFLKSSKARIFDIVIINYIINLGKTIIYYEPIG